MLFLCPGGRGLTLMRSPVGKRPTTPVSGLLAFFPLCQGRRRQPPVACPDGMAVWGPRPCGGTTHFVRRCHQGHGAGRGTSAWSAAASKLLGALVPSSAQSRLSGDRSPGRARRGGGAAHGTQTRRAPPPRRRRGWPLPRRGLRGQGLGAPGRSLTPSDPAGRARAPGSPPVRPGRRWAPPRRSRRLEPRGPSARRGPWAHGLHGARPLLGQEGHGGALAVGVLPWRQGRVASGRVPPHPDGRCRAGPRARGLAARRARGAGPRPRRRRRARAEAARREAIVAPRAPAAGVDGREAPATPARAAAGHGGPPGAGRRVGRRGQVPAGPLHVVPPRGVGVKQGAGHRQAFRHGGPARPSAAPSQAGGPDAWDGGWAPAVPPACA
jgi:hypothetical protein